MIQINNKQKLPNEKKYGSLIKREKVEILITLPFGYEMGRRYKIRP